MTFSVFNPLHVIYKYTIPAEQNLTKLLLVSNLVLFTEFTRSVSYVTSIWPNISSKVLDKHVAAYLQFIRHNVWL